MEAIRYFVMRSLRNMVGSPLLCTAAIFTMGVALAAVGAFLLVVVNLQHLTADWREDLQIVIFLDQEPSQPQVAESISQITALPEVAEVAFINKSQALQRFKKRLGDDSDLLEGVRATVLPASFEVELKPQARTRQTVASVAERLNRELGFSDLQYGKDWLEQFESFTSLVKLIGMVLGSFFIFAAVFIVSNTIKLTLYARRDELEIMTLVGATLRFIKAPFLLEGLIQGILGGLLALALLYGLYHGVLKEGLQVLLLAPTGFTIHFLPETMQWGIAGAGAALGLLGSLLALRKFVRI